MNEHYQWAKKLKNKYPFETQGLTIGQVQKAWEKHSESYAAGWLLDDNIETVHEIMNKFRKGLMNLAIADSMFSFMGYHRVKPIRSKNDKKKKGKK